ncbi:hypothetical protein GGH16_005923 [Coemansia sp. RSA 560]|nr:hypothetical protein GGH16_005923 [Coemansia sp. RSA 560]
MTCTIDRVVVERTGERPPSPSLLMQERVHERRIMMELDGGEPYHSIYSGSSDESSVSSDESLSVDEDRALCVDMRPLSPLFSDTEHAMALDGADAADLPGIISASSSSLSVSDTHRSVELTAVPVARVGTTASGPSKKQCVQRTRRVHWGTKSTLQDTWLVGRMPNHVDSTRPILTRREPASSSVDVTPPTSSRGTKSRRQSRNLSVVTVSCFEYPDHMVDEPYEECTDPELSMEEYEPADDDEFVPRRSSRKAKN